MSEGIPVGADGPDIIITRVVPAALLEELAKIYRIEQPAEGQLEREQVIARVTAAQALVVVPSVRVDEAVIDAGKMLKIISTIAVGYDNIDVESATQRGIVVTNTPDVVTPATADLALLILLATLRRAGEGYDHVKRGHWVRIDPDAFWGVDPEGLTLGLVGFGRIGQAFASRAKSIGMHVAYHDPSPPSAGAERSLGASRLGFHELLRTADVISVHVPLLPETRGLINSAAFAEMRPGTFFINTSRGPVVDERALVDALCSGHLAGVGLDVYANEPKVPRELRRHPRAFLLPHVGTATYGTRRRMMALAIENVALMLNGHAPKTPVNHVPRVTTPPMDRARAR